MNGCDRMEHYIVLKGQLFDLDDAASNHIGQPNLDLKQTGNGLAVGLSENKVES